MKRIIIVLAALLGLALVPDVNAHPGKHRTPYEKCRDECKAKFKRCFKKNCEPLPDEEKTKCWMKCAGGEVKDCYESCEDKPR